MKKILIAALSAVALLGLMVPANAGGPLYENWSGSSTSSAPLNGCGSSESNKTTVHATRWENGSNNDTVVYSAYPEQLAGDIKVEPSLASPDEALAWIERRNANGFYETVWGPFRDTDLGINRFYKFAVPLSEEYSVNREPRVVTSIKYTNISGTSWCTTKVSWKHNWD